MSHMGSDPGPAEQHSAPGNTALSFIAELGCALLDAGAPSSTVGPGMHQLARRFGVDCEITVLPEGVLSVDTGTGRSSLVLASGKSLRFDQTDRLFDLVQRSGAGGVSAEEGLGELRRIKRMFPLFSAPWRLFGYCLMAMGLCLRQNPGPNEFVVVVLLSVPVAVLVLGMPRLGGLNALTPVVLAFLVGVSVSALVEHGRLAQPAQVVVPLLAMVLPGTLLTVGSLELLRGALQAGAARLVGGIHQLIVLALGLIASEAAFAITAPAKPVAETVGVGAWSPVVGLGVYVVGTCLAFCAPLAAWPALAVVVYVAWGIQQFSDALGGPYASSFLAAAVAVVMARAMYPKLGPPPLLTLNPVFRILGVGGLSLLRVTSLTAGNFVGTDVGAAVFALISVSLGLAAGLALTERMSVGAEVRE
jgi:uncharacterized membrane protein YjjP (DUF1212 family)